MEQESLSKCTNWKRKSTNENIRHRHRDNRKQRKPRNHLEGKGEIMQIPHNPIPGGGTFLSKIKN